MIVIAGGDLVLPGRVLANASLLVDGQRIAALDTRPRIDPSGAHVVDAAGCYVVPGFIDVHVHGVDGTDTLDGPGSVASIASRLPRYGVTAFAPTSVACGPSDLRLLLQQVQLARESRRRDAARVLPAHLESNFINPTFCGAQPPTCLRMPPQPGGPSRGDDEVGCDGDYDAAAILAEIDAHRAAVGIITLAPELSGGIDLVRRFARAGHRVSLGHSGADYDTAVAAIEAGASHATHLFNRMGPWTQREPGLIGALLTREEVATELICDGYHVHPAMCRMAIEAKRLHGVMAITDGTAGSGLPVGRTAMLGGRAIVVRDEAAFLRDEPQAGTLAGSTLTMDRAFARIVTQFGYSVADAASLCSTNAASALGLTGHGVIAAGAIADLVLLDRDFCVVRTIIDGENAYVRE